LMRAAYEMSHPQAVCISTRIAVSANNVSSAV
jgi:hypothetical protein